MAEDRDKKRPWRDALRAWLHPRIATMLLLGFSAGLPLLLIFSTLSVWLREAGVSRSAVTFFSWAALGYSFKFTWAPIVDRMPLPLLTRRLGRRRSWLLLSQFSVTAAICWMALVDPGGSTRGLTVMALAAVLLGFSSATQDIVIDAFRIECAGPTMQGMLALGRLYRRVPHGNADRRCRFTVPCILPGHHRRVLPVSGVADHLFSRGLMHAAGNTHDAVRFGTGTRGQAPHHPARRRGLPAFCSAFPRSLRWVCADILCRRSTLAPGLGTPGRRLSACGSFVGFSGGGLPPGDRRSRGMVRGSTTGERRARGI